MVQKHLGTLLGGYPHTLARVHDTLNTAVTVLMYLKGFLENEYLIVIVTFLGQSLYQFFMFVVCLYHEYI